MSKPPFVISKYACGSICGNCNDFEKAPEFNIFGKCVQLETIVSIDNSCELFNPNAYEFCGICGNPAIEGEHSTMLCTKTENHFCSQWDMEWINMEKVK